jgi:hypothetical protein
MVEEVVVAMGTLAPCPAHKDIGVDPVEATLSTTAQLPAPKELKHRMARVTLGLPSMATPAVQWSISHHKPVRVEVVLAPREATSLNFESVVPVEVESKAT